MQARISQEGEVVVVHLLGRLDIETAEPFKQACWKYLLNKKVVFNFRGLSFVGSSGILPFLETMQSFAEASQERFKFCEMGVEFRKVFAASPLSAIEVFEQENHAIRAFLNPGLSNATVGAVHAAPIMGSQAEEGEAAPGHDFGVLSLRHVPEEGAAGLADEDADDETES